MLTLSGLAVCFNIVTALKNVKNYYRENGTKNNKSKELIQLEISGAVNGLVPFFVFFLTIFTIVIIEPKFINLQFVISIGLIMAFVVGRIIVNNLTLQPFPNRNIPMFIPTFQILIFLICKYFLNIVPIKNIISGLTWFGLGLASGIHFMFINEIIYEFTNYLDIYALSIKHPKKI